jgi:hypothetical protein
MQRSTEVSDESVLVDTRLEQDTKKIHKRIKMALKKIEMN